MIFLPLFAFATLGAVQITAPTLSPYVLQFKSNSHIDDLKDALLSGNWERVKKIGEKGLKDRTISLAEIDSLARTLLSSDLLNIVQATVRLKALHNSVHLDVSDAFALSTFIETTMTGQKSNFFTESSWDLPREIERDPATGNIFILLDMKGSNFLGAGKFKKVCKAIFYNRQMPQIVALAISTRPIKNEIKAMKALQGLDGVLSAISFLYGDNRWGIVTPIYSPGGLNELIEADFDFSFKEKVKIAQDILTGVANIHEHGYVHLDLGARNYLVNIKDRGHGRTVSAVVSDFGFSRPYKGITNTRVQGNCTYLAPEGFYREKMHGEDYVRSDVYAVGCVLWKLYFEEGNPWGEKCLFKSTNGSLDSRYKEHVRLLEKYTDPVRKEIKKIANTPKGQFLSIVLKLLQFNPKKRGTAREAANAMNDIYSKL